MRSGSGAAVGSSPRLERGGGPSGGGGFERKTRSGAGAGGPCAAACTDVHADVVLEQRAQAVATEPMASRCAAGGGGASRRACAQRVRCVHLGDHADAVFWASSMSACAAAEWIVAMSNIQMRTMEKVTSSWWYKFTAQSAAFWPCPLAVWCD
eukprot:CAMPEP_0119410392 /NCGR_PEP_ID=MMETSP1335-20130426/3421_1 /TAXON_ID=259385 /ORGANISM="Chrysoculter rhomboideus, Strain RCC1486" /LENGTH=152 /DNA_ID=CAMNT_0007434913 /DNA_START=393 /DNA_END=851 /DNA_ORIENTATION=-